MVQIIRIIIESPFLSTKPLYIPRGSDNTWISEYLLESFDILYIPHGSDNTAYITDEVKPLRILYIPHGSDNTHFHYYTDYNS